MRVAFIGLGNMGFGMAVQLATKNIETTGFDLRPQVVQDFVTKTGSGKGASSVAEAAEGKDAIIIMTINDAQARAILFENGGLKGLAKDAVVVLMSTVSPDAAKALEKQIHEARPDVGLVDAPVSGGSPGANSGTLTIMASGSSATFKKAQPLLNAMGSKVHHVGEAIGQGQSMKAINQVLCGVHLVAAAEALSMAKASGIDPALALGVVKESAAGSWMLSNRAQRMLEETPECHSSVQTWAKDLGIVQDLARGQHCHAPLAAGAAQIFNAAMARGLAMEDDTTVSVRRQRGASGHDADFYLPLAPLQIIRQYDFLNGNDRR